MKQSLIFVIIVSLLVFTIQTVTHKHPRTTTTYNGRCICGWRLDKNGKCTIRIKENCRHTSINSHKCPKGKFYICKNKGSVKDCSCL